jgi:hypothetical protein
VHVPFINSSKGKAVGINEIRTSYISYVITASNKNSGLVYLRKNTTGKAEKQDYNYNFFHHKK